MENMTYNYYLSMIIIATFIEHFLFARHFSKCFMFLCPVILTAILLDGHYYY